MSSNGFRLITLGRLAFLSPSGEEDQTLGKRRRKLALLAVLALATQPYSRDVLADMFWGDQDEERAKHSLSDALSHLRRVLGRGTIATRQADIALSRDAGLRVDALMFAAACEARDYERAVALYGGPFLEGVYVKRSPRFESWVTRERSRLEQLFVRACEAQCMVLARTRRWEECGALARRWLDVAPLSVDAALYLLNARKAPDTREALLGALTEYEAIAAHLAWEYETQPDPRVAQLAAGLRARLAAQGGDMPHAGAAGPPARDPAVAAVHTPEGQPAARVSAESHARPAEEARPPAPAHAEESSAPVQSPPARLRRPRRRKVLAAAAALLLLGLGAAGILVWSSRNAQAGSPIPVVAVTLIQNVRHDSSVAWLQDGLKQMIAADLSHSPAVEVVAPSRVRDLIARAQFDPEHGLSTEDAVQIARRLGATWAVSGGITKGNGVYVVDVGLRNARSGKLLRLFTVTGSDILAVADQAAARILAAANAQSPGPHLADVETSSLSAYQHYVRGLQAATDGRYGDEVRELDAAIAADSGFVSAILVRLDLARMRSNHALEQRLVDAFTRARGRASEWDRRVQDIYTAYHNGEHDRAEQLARELVARYPHDPRAYHWLGVIYESHGRWGAADTVFQQALSLDSLALEAGHGPCAACTGLDGLSWLRLYRGDLAGGERAARRRVALQPDAPSAWGILATALAYAGRYDEALKAVRRASLLSGGEAPYAMMQGRILVMARRLEAADSAAAEWLTRPDGPFHADALELRAIVLRERGQLRAANRVIDSAVTRYRAGDLVLTKAYDLGLLGEWDAAKRIFEGLHPYIPPDHSRSPFAPLDGDAARSFSWHHALQADAIAASGDTTYLRALADSIQMVSARSYYGRDWRLAHHVRGLIALQGHRYAEAAKEFRQAMWGVNGWTVTNAGLARAELALHRPRQAILALREAYEAPPDAMGRYETRSQLDLLMALAFRRAGEADSSAVYAGYVRRAWRHADPEVKARLALLDEPATPAPASRTAPPAGAPRARAAGRDASGHAPSIRR